MFSPYLPLCCSSFDHIRGTYHSSKPAALLASLPTGGVIGDRLAAWSPNHGRIVAAQMTVFFGLPFSFWVLWGLPHLPLDAVMTVPTFCIVMFCFGLTISWAAPACNSPIFAEIVPEHMRSTVYAFDRSFEGALAAW